MLLLNMLIIKCLFDEKPYHVLNFLRQKIVLVLLTTYMNIFRKEIKNLLVVELIIGLLRYEKAVYAFILNLKIMKVISSILVKRNC